MVRTWRFMVSDARRRFSLPRRVPRPEDEGGWRAEKRKILMARALRHAGAFRRANKRSSSEAIAHQKMRDTALSKRMLFCGRFRHRALLSSGPSRSECADRSVSQLLAGTPSGPGGSSNAARVPRCDEARRRRTPSRLTTPHETPLTGRGECIISEVWQAGIMRGQLTQSRHPGESRDPGATGTERAALDTGFRRYDGAC